MPHISLSLSLSVSRSSSTSSLSSFSSSSTTSSPPPRSDHGVHTTTRPSPLPTQTRHDLPQLIRTNKKTPVSSSSCVGAMANHSSSGSGSSSSSSSRPKGSSISTPSSSRSHNKTTSVTSATTLSEDKDRQAIWVNPLKTPSFPEGSGHCSLTHGIHIDAPAALVLSVLLDTRYYHQWNPFCPQLPIYEQPRMTAPIPPCIANDPAISSIAHLPTTLRDACKFTMPVYLDTQGLSDERRPAASAIKGSASVARSFKITVLESFELNGRVGLRVAWRLCSKVTQYIIRSERVYELVAAAEDPSATDLLVWETFHGPLAPTMKATYGRKLERGCVTWSEGMKRHAESRARGIRGMAKEVLDVREPVLEEDEEQ